MAKIATPQVRQSTRSRTGSFSDEERRQIEALAYQFFVDRGYQHGHDSEDWLRAEQTVRSKRS